MSAPNATMSDPTPAEPQAANRHSRAALLTLAAGAVAGLIGDTVFRGGEPGINLFLWIGALAGLAAAVGLATNRLHGSSRWLLIAAGFASCFAVRRAEFAVPPGTRCQHCSRVTASLSTGRVSQRTHCPRR